MKSQQNLKVMVISTTFVLALGSSLLFIGIPAFAQEPTSTPCSFGNIPNGSLMEQGGMMGQGHTDSRQQCTQMTTMLNMMSNPGNMGNMFVGGMMMGGMMNTGSNFGPGIGMMGAWMPPTNLAPASGKSLVLDEASTIAKAYIAAWNSTTTLELGEVMQFSNHFYGEAVESGTKRGAFAFLIDPTTGTVYAEPGPNMMWNLRYSTMGSSMGLSQTNNDGDKMTIAPDQAVKNAQDYLDKTLPGAKAEDKPLAFYGFYMLDIVRDGKVAGMLSVNGYTGQVWLHHWHGDFVTATSPQ